MVRLEKIRTFFEVRLAEKTQRAVIELIAKIQPNFEENGWKIRWVHPDNVHLTLRFLGDIDPPMVNVLKRTFTPLAQMRSFDIVVKGLGAFPSFGSPRVIWVGVEDPQQKLSELAARLEEGLVNLGFKEETRRFQPHVTVGRVVRRGTKPLVDLIGAYGEIEFGIDRIRDFIFMKSQLTTTRAIHTPLWNIQLSDYKEELEMGEVEGGTEEGEEEGRRVIPLEQTQIENKES